MGSSVNVLRVETMAQNPFAVPITPSDVRLIGKIINNLSAAGSQLTHADNTAIFRQSIANLQKFKKECSGLFDRLDEVARSVNNEIPGRIVEDLQKIPFGVGSLLALSRRCHCACQFLSLCIVNHVAAPQSETSTATETALLQETRH